MVRLVAIALGIGLIVGGAVPSDASTQKQEFCAIQGDIVAALSRAKLDRVPEKDAVAHVTKDATWPAKYNAAIPIYVGEVYKLKRKVLRETDMAANWRTACLEN